MTTAHSSHWQLPRQLHGNRHCLLFIATSSCHDNQPPHLSLADWEHPALLWFLSFASNNSPSLFFFFPYHHPQLSLIPFFFNWICDPLQCSHYGWTEWLSHQFPWAADVAVTSPGMTGLGWAQSAQHTGTEWGKQTLFSHVRQIRQISNLHQSLNDRDRWEWKT